jgi:sortase A
MRIKILLQSPGLEAVRVLSLIAGVSCLSIFGYSYWASEQYQEQASVEFDKSVREQAATAPHAPTARAASRVESRAVSADSSSLGRLEIPRLHLTTMVRQGVDAGALRLAVGHVPETAMPGQPGNVALAGHRDTLFRKLRDLQIQDEITFSTVGGTFRYKVTSMVIVEPDNTRVLDASGENTLTLITCYPFRYVGSAPRRFVVRARQIAPTIPARCSPRPQTAD